MTTPIDLQRRKFTLGFAALAASIQGCGGGGGSTPPESDPLAPPPPPAPPPPAPAPAPSLTITAISPDSPLPRTAIYLATTGLDLSQPYTATITVGPNSTAVVPVRTQSDGTIVLPVPVVFDPSTGLSTAYTMSIVVSQGTSTSNAFALDVQDLPSSASYGAKPGDISRGFLNYMTISLGQTLNYYQALRAFPSNLVDTSSARSALRGQINSTLEMRDNVDLIVSGSQPSLTVGATNGGTKLAFDANSVEMMDRILAMHLQAIGYLPSGAGALSAGRRHAVHIDRAIVVARSARPLAVNLPQLITTIGALGTVPALVSGTLGVVQPITDKPGHSLADNLVAGLQLVAVGATVLTIGTEAAAAAAVFGAAVAVAAVGLDLYNIAASPGGFANATTADYVKLAADGLGAFAAVGSGVVAVADAATAAAEGSLAKLAAESLENPFGSTGRDLLFQGAGFVSGLAGTGATIATLNSAESENAGHAGNQVGTAQGTATVTNGAGPILSALPGIDLTDPATGDQFITVGDANGNYDLIVPIGVAGMDYSQMQVATFDPVTNSATGSAVTCDLTGLSPLTPLLLPGIVGECVDDDAGDPDEDDPDCD